MIAIDKLPMPAAISPPSRIWRRASRRRFFFRQRVGGAAKAPQAVRITGKGRFVKRPDDLGLDRSEPEPLAGAGDVLIVGRRHEREFPEPPAI
jgi:hypothetical protein